MVDPVKRSDHGGGWGVRLGVGGSVGHIKDFGLYPRTLKSCGSVQGQRDHRVWCAQIFPLKITHSGCLSVGNGVGVQSDCGQLQGYCGPIRKRMVAWNRGWKEKWKEVDTLKNIIWRSN